VGGRGGSWKPESGERGGKKAIQLEKTRFAKIKNTWGKEGKKVHIIPPGRKL